MRERPPGWPRATRHTTHTHAHASIACSVRSHRIPSWAEGLMMLPSRADYQAILVCGVCWSRARMCRTTCGYPGGSHAAVGAHLHGRCFSLFWLLSVFSVQHDSKKLCLIPPRQPTQTRCPYFPMTTPNGVGHRLLTIGHAACPASWQCERIILFASSDRSCRTWSAHFNRRVIGVPAQQVTRGMCAKQMCHALVCGHQHERPNSC